MKRTKIKLLLFFLFVSVMYAFPATEIKSSRIDKGNLVIGSQIIVYNEKYQPSVNWTNQYEYISHMAAVRFGLDETRHKVYTVDFITTITYNVKAYSNNGTLTNFNGETLSFTYKRDGVYSDKSEKNFGNYAKLVITVTNITSQNIANSASITNPAEIFMEGEIKTTCFYKFQNNPLTPSSSAADFNYKLITNPCPGGNCVTEIEVYWPYYIGAEQYELEWTWVNDYPGATHIFDFAHDATRIVTNNNYYRIPIVYEKGAITFRYRCIGRKGLSTSDRIESRWSSSTLYPDFGKLVNLPANLKYFINTANSSTAENMNWTATMTFAEDGKKGSGISYLDGLLASRQSQAKLNTEDKTIAQQTIYDYQGRPAISVLPAPLNKTYFQYDASFSKNTSNPSQPYSKADFDTDFSICTSGTLPMSKSLSTGAANYYSPNNTNQAGAQGYLPDAKEFPFVQVEYTPDNTGRLITQTMPGEAHKLGNGHETKFYYANPSQAEVSRLFGSEAGNVGHYDKNMVADANGQISATYMDMSGRAVATALMGANPPALDQVADYNNNVALVDDLILFNKKDPDNYTIISSKNIFAESANSVQTFKYEFTPEDFTDNVCTPLKCFDCIYEVEFSIKDECGIEITKTGYPAGQTIKQTVGAPITPGNISVCDNPSLKFELDPQPISVTFPKIGTYKVTKTLKVSDVPINQYINEYLQNNTCVKSLKDFITQETNVIDFSTCGTDCQSCSTSVNQYVQNHQSLPNINQIAAELYQNCQELCASFDPCAASRQAMLTDFYPCTGQYAQCTMDGSGNYTDVTSIFYIGTIQNPSRVIHYASVSYPGILVTLPNGQSVSPAALTPQQFITYFKPEWAKFLLPYHPEYAYLAFCELNAASDQYDYKMLQVNTFAEADQKGFLEPLAGITGNSSPVISPDPFFDTGGQGLVANDAVSTSGFTDQFGFSTANATIRGVSYTYKNFMLYAFNNRYPMLSTPLQNVGIYDLARLQAGGAGPYIGNDPCTTDKEWLTFRALYLNYKLRLVAQRRTDFVLQKQANASYPQLTTQNTGFNGCMTGSGLGNFVPSAPNNLFTTTNGSYPTSPAPTSLNFLPFTFNPTNNHQAGFYYTFMAYPLTKLPAAKNIANPCVSIDYNPYGGDIRFCGGWANMGGEPLQPCSYNNSQYFYNKIARFPQIPFDINALINSYNLTVPAPAPVLPPVNVVTQPGVSQNYCNDICNSYAEELMLKIAGCNQAIDKTNPNFVLATYNLIKSQLVDVCKNGCDKDNPFGSSSVAVPSPNSPPVAFDSFAEVLAYHFGASTPLCDPDLIGMPKPYGSNISNTNNNPPKLNTCGCDMVLGAKFRHFTAPIQGISTPEQYFTHLYGYPLPNYEEMFCKCFAAWNVSPPPNPQPGSLFNWYSNILINNGSWSPQQVSAIPNITVPAFLDCPKPCLPCSTVVNAINSYNQSHPTYIGSNNYSTLLENHLNNQFSYNMSFSEYMDFYDHCGTAPVCYTPVQIANKLKNLANQWLVLYNNSLPAGPFAPNLTFYSAGAPALPSLFNSPGTPDFLTCATPNGAPSSSGLIGLPSIYTNQQYTINGRGAHFSNIIDASVGLNCEDCELILEDLNIHGVGSPPMQPAPLITHLNLLGGDAFIFSMDNGNTFHTGYFSCMSDIVDCGKLCNTALNNPTPVVENCAELMLNNAYNNAVALFDAQNKSIRDNFIKRYKEKCLQLTDEKFERNYNLREYHYTLYYYDQAGSLVRTVPPKGVTILPANQYNTIPTHTYVTKHEYQSYGGPLSSKSPDENATTEYVYDINGRIVASANAKQKVNGTSSYTFYDKFGRIVEVGEVNLSISSLRASAAANTFVTDITNNGLFVFRKEVISTIYDVAISPNISSQFPNSLQANLRNRVASITYEPSYDGDPLTYRHATHYSYDEHGNLKNMVQENGALYGLTSPFFSLEYSYDLISGNMNKVSYQKGKRDAFFHKYEYDDDNRLHIVYTSKDDIIYDRDAKYFYYEHGPLARKELGDQKVHAEDFAYTIQGWIKAVNSNKLSAATDIGKDGDGSSYSATVKNIHKYFGRDALGYSINYYGLSTFKDYTAIKSPNYNGSSSQDPLASISNINPGAGSFNLQTDAPDLFNGNVSSMVTSFIDIDPTNNITNKTPFPQITAYKYDQLHRIKQMKAHRGFDFTNNAWNNPGAYDGSYQSSFTYDKNGNIATHTRNGFFPNLVMDNMTYRYEDNTVPAAQFTNRLVGVNDAATTSVYTSDIKNPNNAVPGMPNTYDYEYDEIGNLLKDKKEFIADIKWTPDRKVKEVIRDAAAMFGAGKNLPDLVFEYDANRQRVLKIEKPRNNTAPYNYKNENDWLVTYYVRDADGNLMTTYSKYFAPVGQNFSYNILGSEYTIYGSGRLGADVRETQASVGFGLCNITPGNPPTVNYTMFQLSPFNGFSKVTHMLGDGNYELSNHLGNVIAVVSDRKIMESGNTESEFIDFETSGYPNRVTTQGFKSYSHVQEIGVQATPNSTIMKVKTPAGSVINARVWAKNQASSSALLTIQFWNLTTNTSISMVQTAIPTNGGYNLYTLTSGPAPAGNVEARIFVYNLNMNPVFIDDFSYTKTDNSNLYFSHYTADVKETHDYYPFGYEMPGRTFGNSYAYNFNDMRDDKWNGNGSSYLDFGARIYDGRLGRWLSEDPDKQLYPNNSPYHFGYNNPIYYKDKNGGVISGTTKEDFKIVYASVLKIFSDAKLKKDIFQIDEDNKTQFKKISAEDFAEAIQGLDENAKALAKGYYEAINSDYEYHIKIVDNNTAFNDDFRNSLFQSITGKESFNARGFTFGKDIANLEFNGGDWHEDGNNRSVIILNQEYITNESKIQRYQSLSSEMRNRDFNSALTNAIFGEFFVNDNFIVNKRKRLKNEHNEYLVTKLQMENLALFVQGLYLTNGYPMFEVFNHPALTKIPVELQMNPPAKTKNKKRPTTHGNDRHIEWD